MKPTPEQQKFLRARRIVPPPDRSACTCLVNYILTGHPTSTSVDRAQLALRTQKKWSRKRAWRKSDSKSKPITISYITAKPVFEMANELRKARKEGRELEAIWPFYAVFTDDGKQYSEFIPLTQLSLEPPKP